MDIEAYQSRERLKKIITWLSCLLVLLIGFFGGLILRDVIVNNKSTEEKTKTTEGLRLEDDFYDAVNEMKIKNMIIPQSQSSWSTFHDAQLEVNTRKQQLISKIINDKDYSNESMEIMIEVFTDYEGRNKRGLSELQEYFDLIDGATTLEEFDTVLLKLDHDLNSNGLLSISIEPDLYDTSKNVLYFSPIMAEDNFEIFTISKYSKYADYYRDYRKKVLSLAGWSESEIDEYSNELEKFIEAVQSKSKELGSVTDSLELYNKYTLDDIKNNLDRLPILKFLERYSLDDQDYYVFYDFEHYIALNDYYTIDNLEFFKKFEKMLILERVAAVYTTDEFFSLHVDLSNKIKGTNRNTGDFKYEMLTKIKENYIGDDLAKKYEEEYFTNEDKQVVIDLIEEIKAYYKEVVKNSDFLSESTKEEAIKKLDNMKINVGYIEKKSNVEKVKYVSKKDGGTLISNYILGNRNSFDILVDELHSEGDALYRLDTFEVNAAYSPLNNSINFSAAFKNIYENEKSYYRQLAYIGTIIGHELSHAFDITGAKFDEEGNIRDWWTEEDKEKYEELSKKIVDYYNQYEIDGHKIDGEKTLNENIADLASMNCMMAIMEKKGATEEDYKEFFEAYADLWAGVSTEEAIENQILTDEHSPNKIRVNAVLSSTDKFYEIYNIDENDKMYVAKENRVGIWK